ncbi:MAG: SAM-dependent methyltransferase [Ruminococcaceae bacterium]|nr:SAM-dependent methyltransferase [Oscillospiraceae bacterium]
MKVPVLSPRLKKIADSVGTADNIADVGTDHGLLPAYLLVKEMVRHAYASDINEGPLTAAKRTLSSFGVSDKADLILCDGLTDVLRFNPEKIVIAGMGGETIAGILEPLKKTTELSPSLFLQPMSKKEKVRECLYDLGYTIDKELLCGEDDRIYNIIIASRNDGTADSPRKDDVMLYIGDIDRSDEESAELEKEYLSRLLEKTEKRYKGLKASDKSDKGEMEFSYRCLCELKSRIKRIEADEERRII